MSPHQNRLVATLVYCKFLDFEAILLGNLLLCPAHNFPVNLGQHVIIQQGGAVDWLSAKWSRHFQVATFVVPAPVLWVALQVQCLPNGFRLGILLIASMRLCAWRFRMWSISNLRFLSEPTNHVVCLIAVDGVTFAMGHLHVLWRLPLAVVDLLLCGFPFLFGHLRLLQGLGQPSHILFARRPAFCRKFCHGELQSKDSEVGFKLLCETTADHVT
mmetsp:Transcript_42066/g.94577  ORF Transcript_42066/g.94577 Transcript_42066/m.94577 type:complete len:215 (-) Transcript_42066:3-647(-)